MRETLKYLAGKRIEVFATVEKFGKKAAFKGPPQDTVLIIGLMDKFNNLLADHLWLTVGKQIKCLGLRPGERIKFCHPAQIHQGVPGFTGGCI